MTVCARQPRRRAAFTLLEVLLSLSLAAMLGYVIYLTVSIVFKAREMSRTAVDLTRTSMIASEVVRQDLESVLPPTGVLAGEFYGEPKSGQGGLSADWMYFYAVGSDRHRLGDDPLAEGIRYVELYLDTDQNPPALMRRVKRNLLPSNADDFETEVLCRGVRGMEINYYDGSVWTDRWDSTSVDNTLPAAVSITLDFDRPGQAPGQNVYRVRRVIPLACVTPEDATSSSSSGTGSTGGTSR